MEVELKKVNDLVIPQVGDVYEVGTGAQSSYYQVCQTNSIVGVPEYFIMNLNGKKGRAIRYYDTLEQLAKARTGSPHRLFPQKACKLVINTSELIYESK